MTQHAANGSTVIIAYDDQARAPEARQELHAKRYRKLPAAPVTMNRRTHTFVHGRSVAPSAPGLSLAPERARRR